MASYRLSFTEVCSLSRSLSLSLTHRVAHVHWMMSVDLAGVNNPHLLREHGKFLCVHRSLAHSTNTHANLHISTHNPQEKVHAGLKYYWKKKRNSPHCSFLGKKYWSQLSWKLNKQSKAECPGIKSLLQSWASASSWQTMSVGLS